MANAMIRGGFYPFWFWNDTLTPAEIRWQVKEMAAQGVRGFFVHPRQGLGQPYLSESFMDMIGVAVQAAEEHGLSVCLYDEYPYPSGVAGGKVILGEPAFYATRLVHRAYVVDGGPIRLELPRGKILSCMAFPLQGEETHWGEGIDLKTCVGPVLLTESFVETGLTRYNRKRYFASDPVPVLETTLPESQYKILVSAQVEVNHFKYWDHYVDVMKPEAVRRFLALTHERYWRRFGDRFGGTIGAIFVDETAPGWSDRIPEAFEAAYGYDLCAKMPALQDPHHPEHVRVAHDLYRLTYRMFCDAFERPVSLWCQEHGLAYAGEKGSLRMAQLCYMDVPGCEPGHVKAGARLDVLGGPLRRNAKSTSSAAYFYGKTGALCECYHSMGWSATLQDAKFVADALLLVGISYLVPHGFFYSAHALKKHDAPPSFFFQMPFWPLFHLLSKHVGQIGRWFEGTHIDADVLVVDPASGMPTREDLEAYASLLWLLMENHIDYHIVDTDILQDGRVEGTRLHVADVEAKLILIPPMQIIEEPLQSSLDAFAGAGGRVVCCADAEHSTQAVADILATVQPSLSVLVDGREAASVWVAKREGPDGTLWFLLNTGGESLRAVLQCGRGLRELSIDGGPTSLFEERGCVVRTIRPFESLMLEAVPSTECGPGYETIRVPVRGTATVEVRNANLLRLGEWRMTLPARGDLPAQSATVPAVPLANQLQRGGFSFGPQYRLYFGHAPELTFPELSVSYEATFELDYAGPVELVMEPGSIVGQWQVFVNDAEPLGREHLQPSRAHVRGSLGVRIDDLLHEGRNRLRVEVVTDRADGGLLNPLYLAGNFGVELSGRRLVPRPEQGTFEDYVSNLLPYYAGVVEYSTTFELDRVPAADPVVVEFDYGGLFHQATEVSINGSPFQPVVWQPRHVVLPAQYLVAGVNSLQTRVYTTLVRSFEGRFFDEESHVYRDVGEG